MGNPTALRQYKQVQCKLLPVPPPPPSQVRNPQRPDSTKRCKGIGLIDVAGGDNSNGYSQAELDALNQGKVTDSTSALVDGGLPYNIELNDIGKYLVQLQKYMLHAVLLIW